MSPRVDRIITMTNVGPGARFFCDGEQMIPYREHKRVCDALEDAEKRIAELTRDNPRAAEVLT